MNRRCLVGLLALALLPGLAQAKKKRNTLLSASDVLARAGREVVLAAKLERRGWGLASKQNPFQSNGLWRADLPERTLRFFLGDELLGEATTDGEGVGRFRWTPPGVGDYAIEARFEGDYKYRPTSDDLVVGVRDAGAPLVVLDIDHTLQHTSKRNVLRGKIDDLPLEYSRDVVEALDAVYGVVYVSARATKFHHVTKRWLEHWGFPRRPVYMLDIKRYPTYDEAAYKIDRLQSLKLELPGIWAGVGDKDSDAEAYRAHGLRALILGDVGEIDGAEEVEDWHEVEDLLLHQRRTRFQALGR